MKFTSRHQMLAAAVAVSLSSLAIAHGAAADDTIPQAAPVAAPVTAVATSETALPDATEAQPAPLNAALNERHVACVAKVVHHEAANQPREGQIAVAHVMVNRVREGFAANVCAVARQPGQFFNIDRYNPDPRSKTWAVAEDVARAVLAGETEDHSNGALFFHANWARLNSFFRSRTKVARLEDHDFFR